MSHSISTAIPQPSAPGRGHAFGATADQWPATSNVRRPDEATLDQVLLRIAALAPMIARLGPDIEQGRRLPAELVSALKSAGIYGMLVPRRYGGLELDAPSAFRAVAALARLDGSVGWNAMIGHIGSLLPFLASPALCEEIFQDGKDHVIAGSTQPVGTAERVHGGWRVTGSWPFASGCQNAEWIAGSCVMMEGGSPIDASDGPGPMIRTCLMPAEHWEIRDTWHTFGLKGTGSHHVALTDVLVPDENFFEFPFGASFAPDPIFGKFAEVVVLSHGAVAVGIAEGAIMDLVELAGAGVKQLFMTTPLVETERFKEGLARLDADLMAARALLEAQIARVWQNPERSGRRTWPAWRNSCKRRSGLPRPASASPKVALNSPEAEPCTKARRCNEGCGIFASRPNTSRSIRATT
jgi:indole-3-acetate monooxygenase